MDKITKKGPGTSNQLLFRLWNKFRKIPLLVQHIIWPSLINIKWFLSYSKNYICILFHFHLSFWIWKVWKGREKNYKNLNISRTKRAFLMNWKHFYSFWKAIIWWKNKNLIKKVPFVNKLHVIINNSGF